VFQNCHIFINKIAAQEFARKNETNETDGFKGRVAAAVAVRLQVGK